MPLYFIHLRDGADEVLDPDGIDMMDEAVPGVALLAARDCIAADVRSGLIDLGYRIDVEDIEGSRVYTLPFAKAVKITRAN